MQNSDPFILWLPSWYPNKIKQFDGDFIQRHAQAAALYNSIYVIKIVADEAGVITNNEQTEINSRDNLTEHIIYYKKRRSLFARIFFLSTPLKLYRQAIKDCITQRGKPRLVHVHVAMMSGLLALWIKRKYRIRFVLTEHWAGFAPEARKNFQNLPLYLRIFWKRVVNNAAAVSVVSFYLGELLKKQFSIRKYTVIPNVVNTAIFFPAAKGDSTIRRFVHISGLDYQKNPEAILDAFAILKKSSMDFYLDIFGPVRENLVHKVNELQLQPQVSFHNEVPQKELAKWVTNSDALILYSRYESFGCVIIEANACGVPALVSDLPVFHETIEHGINGLFVRSDDSQSLATAIKDFIEKKYLFDKIAIAESASSKYSHQPWDATSLNKRK